MMVFICIDCDRRAACVLPNVADTAKSMRMPSCRTREIPPMVARSLGSCVLTSGALSMVMSLSSQMSAAAAYTSAVSDHREAASCKSTTLVPGGASLANRSHGDSVRSMSVILAPPFLPPQEAPTCRLLDSHEG